MGLYLNEILKKYANFGFLAIFWPLIGTITLLNHFYHIETFLKYQFGEVLCKNLLRIGFRNEPRKYASHLVPYKMSL